MQYKRTFMLTSSHFNGEAQYKQFERACDGERNSMQACWEAMLSCLKNSHGHNFFITVTVTAIDANAPGALVIDDEALERLVREWDRTNISIHPDFQGARATTEAMAGVLVSKVRDYLLANDRKITLIRVEVQETPEITAMHENVARYPGMRE